MHISITSAEAVENAVWVAEHTLNPDDVVFMFGGTALGQTLSALMTQGDVEAAHHYVRAIELDKRCREWMTANDATFLPDFYKKGVSVIMNDIFRRQHITMDTCLAAYEGSQMMFEVAEEILSEAR